MSNEQTVAIIGAGIIGLTIADYLQRAGKRVLLIDRKGIANEASYGNAGALAFADILPLASKGMIRKAPKWLFDPLGPLSIRPTYLPKVLPWFWRFWRASWNNQYQKSLIAQNAMMKLAEAELKKVCRSSVIGSRVRHDGALQLYESLTEFKSAEPGWKVRENFGIKVQHLHGKEIEAFQPGLSEKIVAATFIPQWKTVDDPHQVAMDFWNRIRERGGELVEKEACRVSVTNIVFADGSTLKADQVVIAAGAWSHKLANQLGDNIPLETERGYNTTLPPGAFDLKRQLIFGEHGFVITPLSTGIRIGGAVEFAGLDAAPNFERSTVMLNKAKTFLPGLKVEGGKPWMGFRPSMPDSLPVIGSSRASKNVIYAFGHGHLGLTQAVSTARLVTELLTGQPPSIDLGAFRPDRF